ncbi:hypothetical protein SPONN_497 [uncultured Candidatus Thioglobus sp.]|nr:hypothetical protein SPONN_497 [uncultured Candidatus Thioglobus sp.]
MAQAALYFIHASWRLDNVAVKNTQEYGLYAKCCNQQLIHNSTFDNNTNGHVKITFDCNILYTHQVVKILYSTFTGAVLGFGVRVKSGYTVRFNSTNVTVQSSIFSSNKKGALSIENFSRMEITSCLFTHNHGIGLSITMHHEFNRGFIAMIIRKCNFTYNRATLKSVVDIKEYSSPHDLFVAEKCLFASNHRNNRDCSVLYIMYTNFTVNDVSIRDNDCTGVHLLHSILKIRNHLNLTRNFGQYGGALRLRLVSQLLFTPFSKVNVFDNIADMHGGEDY